MYIDCFQISPKNWQSNYVLTALLRIKVAPIEIKTQKALPTAHNIPIDKIERAFQKSDDQFKIDHGFPKPSKDYPNVILTCKSGGRAKFAEKLLSKIGYGKLRIYEGSYNDWVANNGPLV